jgi:hypothetical protein
LVTPTPDVDDNRKAELPDTSVAQRGIDPNAQGPNNRDRASAHLLAQEGLSTGQPTGPISSAAAIVLDKHGCVPAQTIVVAGNVGFVVINRTGFDSITFHIRPADLTQAGTASASLLDFTLVNRFAKHHRVLNLASGSYELDLDNHPEWKCSITVN